MSGTGPYQPVPMRRGLRIVRRASYILIWLMVGGVLAAVGVLATQGTSGITTVAEPYELDGVAIRGGVLNIVFDVHRLRLCPSSTTRLLWRWTEINGKALREIVLLPEGGGVPLLDVGENNVVIDVPVPRFITAGRWFYQARTVDYCGWISAIFRARPIRRTPDIPVEISYNDGLAAPFVKFAGNTWPSH